jgi:hypothetical protein
MKKTASTEAAGCRIDGAQDAKKEIPVNMRTILALLTYMSKRWMVLFAVAGIAAAEGVDLGAMAGAGGFTASGPTLAAGQVGVEACVLCAGRFGLFVEYSHWFTSGATHGYNASDVVARADLAGVGLRIQGRGRIRPFFDVGVAGGRDEHVQAGTGGALGGIVVAGGARIPLKGRWYIRPQVRVYGLSPHSLEGLSPHWALSGLVGIGYSW